MASGQELRRILATLLLAFLAPHTLSSGSGEAAGEAGMEVAWRSGGTAGWELRNRWSISVCLPPDLPQPPTVHMADKPKF